MTRRDEIVAVSMYYNINMNLAAKKYEEMTQEEINNVCEWFLDREND